MFAALGQVPGNLPLFETRKALVIINLQNDSFYANDDFHLTKNSDFIPHLKEMIPYFRRCGDIVWVNTHMGTLASAPSSKVPRVEKEAAVSDEKRRQERMMKKQQMQDDSASKGEAARRARQDHYNLNARPGENHPTYYPSSRTKEIMKRSSAETRAERRSANLQVFDDKDNILEEHLSRPRKGQQASFFIAGTKGAEICDELLDVVDESRDLIVTKHHYSAFDQTSLLMALRAKLVTELYLCGCLTNVSIYSTAADAVQHGLQVTVVEDCLGYRNEEKHDEAMRQMADIMGVNGIESEDIIEEVGGRLVPDSGVPGITLEELNLNSDLAATHPDLALAGGESEPQRDISASEQAPWTTICDHPTQGKYKPMLQDKITPTSSSGRSAARNRRSWRTFKSQTQGPNDSVGSGDSRIIYDALSSPLISEAFGLLKDEVGWQTMAHRGGEVPRLVAVQGEARENGDIPIYRHPADASPPLLPFTETVREIRREVEALLSQPFNHALIQLYRDGIDNISEHSDKTLDIVRGSSIVNVSIGAERVMTLRTKKSTTTHGTISPGMPGMRQSQRIRLPHNSVFILGPQSNREWLHGVRADKRPGQEKTDEEKAFGGERISITFRQIGTFMDEKKRTIWGSGAKQKVWEKANEIPSRDDAQMEAMIIAFGKENHDAEFDWDAEYEAGFDVLNLDNRKAKLILCKDSVANVRVQLALCERSISFATVEPEKIQEPESGKFKTRFKPWMHGLSNSEKPILEDSDEDATRVEGDLAVLSYIENRYPFPASGEAKTPQSDRSSYLSQVGQSNELLFLWRDIQDSQQNETDSPATHRHNLERPITPNKTLTKDFYSSLKTWEQRARDAEFIAGDTWTVIDCAFWPVLNLVLEGFGGLDVEKYPALVAYHSRIRERASVKASLDTEK